MLDDQSAVDAVAALSVPKGERDRFGDLIAGNRDDRREMALELIKAMVFGYTRGAGFDGNGEAAPDLQAVILTVTLRFLANPNGLDFEAGSVAGARHFGAGENVGFTLLERRICDRYRVTAK